MIVNFLSVANCCTLLHRANGSFEVLSLHSSYAVLGRGLVRVLELHVCLVSRGSRLHALASTPLPARHGSHGIPELCLCPRCRCMSFRRRLIRTCLRQPTSPISLSYEAAHCMHRLRNMIYNTVPLCRSSDAATMSNTYTPLRSTCELSKGFCAFCPTEC